MRLPSRLPCERALAAPGRTRNSIEIIALMPSAESKNTEGAPAAAMTKPAIDGAIMRDVPNAMEISGMPELN